MRVLPFLLVSLVAILNVAFVQAAKGKSTVAVPRKVKGNAISRSVFGSMFSRAFREMKVTFCSELEALTLQLTRPSDTQVSLKNLDELIRCLNAEYDNPQFTVSLLAKFSRKLCEPNVFTKLKSLVCLHKMMQECDSNAQNALTQSVRSLRSEKDEKVGVSFFSSESIDQAAGTASNVAELQAVELAREYASYVLNFVDFRGEKVPKSSSKGKNKNTKESLSDNEERAELLLELFELSEVVQKCCKQSQNGEVVRQCLACIVDDKSYLTKQMLKIYESGLDDQELELELEQALKKWDSKFKMKTKLSLGSMKDAAAAATTVEVVSITKSVTDKTIEINGKDSKGSKDISEKKSVSIPSVSIPTSSKTAVSITASTVSASVPASVSPPVVMKSIDTASTTPTATIASSSTAVKEKKKEDLKTVPEKITTEKTPQTPSPSELTKTVKTASISSTTSTTSPPKKSTPPILAKEKEKEKVNSTNTKIKINSKDNITKKNISSTSPSNFSKKSSSSSKDDKKTKKDLPALSIKNKTNVKSSNKLSKEEKGSKISKTIKSKSPKKK